MNYNYTYILLRTFKKITYFIKKQVKILGTYL
jgi:hypothetical protein